jgi:hypothetical protein
MIYIKTFENFSDNILQKDIQVYRVENMANASYINGKLYVDSLLYASQLGENILTNTLKQGLKVFEIDGEKNENAKKLKSRLLKEGYDAVKKTTNLGVEYVVFDTTEMPKDKFYFKIGWSDSFDHMAGEPCWFYFDSEKREKYWILSPVGNEHEVDAEMEQYKHKYILFDVESAEMLKSFDTDQEALVWFDTYMIAGTLPS